jgi:cytochrome P450
VTLPSYEPPRKPGNISPVAAWLAHPPPWVWSLIRNLWPIPRLAGWALVSRYDDVAEVLTRSDAFGVPFGEEIARLNDGSAPGTSFMLGIDDRNAHDRQAKLVMQAFTRADVERVVAPVSYQFATNVLDGAGNGPVDAISALITATPLELCHTYYGIQIEDPAKFASASIDVSGHLFGPPPIKPKPAIDVAAAYVSAVVQSAIDCELEQPSGRDLPLPRLIALHQQDSVALPVTEIRAFLIGMIVGFVPTNTIAGGHILEMLLRNREFMVAARTAAEAGDDDLLKHCLFEAMRFMPLNPGPFRICSRDYTVAAGSSRAATIRAGTKILASTMSAMLDPRQLNSPRRFDPRRPASDYMLFGYGMHWCVGTYIAQAQITQMFKALLERPGLRRAAGTAGKLKRHGLFPHQLKVEWGRTE